MAGRRARDSEYAMAFMDDLSRRLANRVQLTSDGHRAYLEAVERCLRRRYRLRRADQALWCLA
ncbi:msr9760 (plasmid) [Mesorhizobium japonicum MAFF 303099]|uniref:Msr9760 protein n=1 Tax=Mesorhizobium japonicum (strain LMG 29417 / CECT 9101 / MAFF 303099) TaxID=266835 RepID=Q98P75_RHILO|nr:msr9760 [Mesorhizobium japonicum MAFF 303099]